MLRWDHNFHDESNVENAQRYEMPTTNTEQEGKRKRF